MAAPDEQLLMVNVYGPDQPGVLAVFAGILLQHGIKIVDIEQASLQNMLGLHMLLDPSEATSSQDTAVKDLLYEANRLDLTLNFKPFAADHVQRFERRRLIVLTLFGGTRAIAELATVLGDENANIETISSMSHHSARSFEMVVNISAVADFERLKHRTSAKSRELNVDLALQSMNAHRKNKRLICFDMDSTLVEMEGIDEMARQAGVYREVARITEKAMRGELDFKASLRQRVAMLNGVGLRAVQRIRDEMPLSPGVEELITTLKWLGFKLGVVSGGFDIFADHLKDRFDLDFSFANQLEIKNDALTGQLNGDIVDAARKARLVNQVACDLGIPLDQVVAIGDGANDAMMLAQAGLGIAYNAKPALDRVANASLSRAHFKHIFHLLGINEEDIDEAMSCRAR